MAGIEAAIRADLQATDAGQVVEKQVHLARVRIQFVDALAALHIGEEEIARRIAAQAIGEDITACDFLPRLIIADVILQRNVLGEERGGKEAEGEEGAFHDFKMFSVSGSLFLVSKQLFADNCEPRTLNRKSSYFFHSQRSVSGRMAPPCLPLCVPSPRTNWKS